MFKKFASVALAATMMLGAAALSANAAEEATYEANETATVYVLGDVDGSSVIDISDATAIQKHVARISLLDEAGQAAADVDKSGTIDISDATMIQKYVAKIISSFDEPEEPEEKVIYFDVAKSGWEGVKNIYCHVWASDGTGTWPQWQTKAEKCTYDAETGIATYKLSKTGNEISESDGRIYCIIFSSDNSQQTFDTIMSGSCIGDTAYCEGGLVDNPVDSQKKCYLAKWENNPECGAVKTITSTGDVVGTGRAEGVTDADLFAGYMISYYNDAEKMANIQNIINNDSLSFTRAEVDASLETKLADNEDKDAISETVKTLLDACTFPNG